MAVRTTDDAAALVTGGSLRPPQAKPLRHCGLDELAVRGPCDTPPPPTWDV